MCTHCNLLMPSDENTLFFSPNRTLIYIYIYMHALLMRFIFFCRFTFMVRMKMQITHLPVGPRYGLHNVLPMQHPVMSQTRKHCTKCSSLFLHSQLPSTRSVLSMKTWRYTYELTASKQNVELQGRDSSVGRVSDRKTFLNTYQRDKDVYFCGPYYYYYVGLSLQRQGW